ncbi:MULTISPECIES: hypothetical protein [unclassified Aeromicrobium]|uniref:hypothetical protein n=1 Tax=unclassified Aeromicrobium TaxID=2633570 RepID=UPI00288A8E8C|nr:MULTISPECIES: hypothetical protein [unclassified Aeromicrobium]
MVSTLIAAVIALGSTLGAPTVSGELLEDEYGWNCWVDGNGACGDGLDEVEPGCLSNPDDIVPGYTMCADGRVYTLTSNGPADVVVRVLS